MLRLHSPACACMCLHVPACEFVSAFACMVLVSAGACWCLLVHAGACWCLLAPVGACWLVPVGEPRAAHWCLKVSLFLNQLVARGACWCLLVPVGPRFGAPKPANRQTATCQSLMSTIHNCEILLSIQEGGAASRGNPHTSSPRFIDGVRIAPRCRSSLGASFPTATLATCYHTKKIQKKCCAAQNSTKSAVP